MIINVTDTFSRAEYVDIIAFDLHLLDTTPPPIMEEYKRGDMIGITQARTYTESTTPAYQLTSYARNTAEDQ